MAAGIISRAINYVQSNDLLYRVALDATSYDLPTLATARNKDERRELIVTLIMTTGIGLAIAPVGAYIFNKIFSKKLNNNLAFLKLNWEHLEAGKGESAIQHLEKMVRRTNQIIEDPHKLDALFINKIKKSRQNLERALKTIKENPGILTKVAQQKQKVALCDLLVVGLLTGAIAPMKNWVSRFFAGKDRFTGTQNYLSDQDLKTLVGEKKKTTKRQKIVSALLVCLPSALYMTNLKMVQKTKGKGFIGKFFKLMRHYMDYDNAIFMRLMSVFIGVSVVKWGNLLNFARDPYERVETLTKFALIIPSFYWGDLFFNGNIARLTDKYLHKNNMFPAGTFYNPTQSGKILAHTRPIKDTLDYVTKQGGIPKNVKKAGKIASVIFITGYAVHTAAVYGSILLANRLTKKRVTHDLATMNPQEKQQSK